MNNIRYALFDYNTGEVRTSYSEEQPHYAAKHLYKIACSLRRFALLHDLPQSNLMLCLYDFDKRTIVRIVEEWKGDLYTPLEDLKLYVRGYNTLKKFGAHNVKTAFAVIERPDFSAKVGRATRKEIYKALMPYDRAAMRVKLAMMGEN